MFKSLFCLCLEHTQEHIVGLSVCIAQYGFLFFCLYCLKFTTDEVMNLIRCVKLV